MSTIFARPTLYRGIQMRSRLEAAWAEQFDSLGWEWAYEPICLAGPDGQYLPDFVVKTPFRRSPTVVEVKGGWWEKPSSYGYADDADDGWAETYERTFADRKLWSGLVAAWDPRAMFVMALQHEASEQWPAGHLLEIWRPGHASFTPDFSATICTCPEGCTGFVSRARSECDHGHPWKDATLVPSLHGQWRSQRRDFPLYDPLVFL